MTDHLCFFCIMWDGSSRPADHKGQHGVVRDDHAALCQHKVTGRGSREFAVDTVHVDNGQRIGKTTYIRADSPQDAARKVRSKVGHSHSVERVSLAGPPFYQCSRCHEPAAHNDPLDLTHVCPDRRTNDTPSV